jgi:hypothetical protein
VNKENGVITIDGWTNGTPTNGQKFLVDGWVIDLPRCQNMVETFEPDYLIHSLYGGDSGNRDVVKFRGWRYEVELDYSEYISADTIFALRNIMNCKKFDQLFVIPHIDKQKYQYNVYFSNQIDLERYGLSPGHKNFKLKLKSKETVPFPNESGGYGTMYGYSYGSTGW